MTSAPRRRGYRPRVANLNDQQRADYLMQCVTYIEGRIQFVDEKAERLLALLTLIVGLTGLVPGIRDVPSSWSAWVRWSLALCVLAVLVAAVLRNVLLCIRPTATFFIGSTGGRSDTGPARRRAEQQLKGWFSDRGDRDRPAVSEISLMWPTPRQAWEKVDKDLRDRHALHVASIDGAGIMGELTATHLRLLELVSRKYRYYDAANTAARSLLVLWVPLVLVIASA
jgi:hypothetical protein